MLNRLRNRNHTLGAKCAQLEERLSMEIATLEQRKEDKQTMLAKIQQTSQQELYARNKVESEWDAR